jgi:hypothetical protein
MYVVAIERRQPAVFGISQSDRSFSIAILTSWLRVFTPAVWKSSRMTAFMELSEVYQDHRRMEGWR